MPFIGYHVRCRHCPCYNACQDVHLTCINVVTRERLLQASLGTNVSETNRNCYQPIKEFEFVQCVVRSRAGLSKGASRHL